MKQNNGTPQETKVFGITIKKGSGKSGKAANQINPEEFTFSPKNPKVNVIPAELTEKYEVKGIIRKTAGVVAGVAVIFGLIYAGGAAYAGVLNSELEAKVAERNDLTAEVTALSPYQDYKTAVDAKRTTLSGEVSTDVNFGTIYQNVFDVSQNNNVSITTLSVTQTTGEEEGSCLNPDPFTEVQGLIGCITIEGQAQNPSGADAFVSQLVALPGGGYINPFITSISTTEDGGTNFNGTVSFTDKLYSNKYAELALPLQDLLAADTAPAEGEEVAGGEIEQVVYQSEVTNLALSLVPELAEENLVKIDGFAVAACQADGDIPTALKSIKGVLIQRLPADDTTVDDIVAQLENTLTTECGGE